MNTTDMYSREKANQAHLDDLRHHTRDSRLLREAAASDGPEARAVNRRLTLALAGAAAAALIVVVLLALAATGQPIL
jgi:hypothetical protein